MREAPPEVDTTTQRGFREVRFCEADHPEPSLLRFRHPRKHAMWRSPIPPATSHNTSRGHDDERHGDGGEQDASLPPLQEPVPTDVKPTECLHESSDGLTETASSAKTANRLITRCSRVPVPRLPRGRAGPSAASHNFKISTTFYRSPTLDAGTFSKWACLSSILLDNSPRTNFGMGGVCPPPHGCRASATAQRSLAPRIHGHLRDLRL